MTDRAYIALLSLVPKAAMSRLLGAAARAAAPRRIHRAAVHAFARAYGVDADEADRPLAEYATFGEFFTRRLRPGARPVAPGEEVPVSPVDGTVYAVGVAHEGRLLQAKGVDYDVASLVAGAEAGRPFAGGAYATIYLAPRNYHRIHAPLGGRITGYAVVPGALWPVNPPAVRTVRGLFAQNERLITFLDTPLGACAVVKVGATCVGRIRACYDDVVTTHSPAARRHTYPSPLTVAKGDEIGVFEVGSTVIVLFERGRVVLDPQPAGAALRMGQAIGRRGTA